MRNSYLMHLKIIYTVSHKKGDTKLMPVTSSNLNPVFQLHGSQSMPGPSLVLTPPPHFAKIAGYRGGSHRPPHF